MTFRGYSLTPIYQSVSLSLSLSLCGHNCDRVSYVLLNLLKDVTDNLLVILLQPALVRCITNMLFDMPRTADRHLSTV